MANDNATLIASGIALAVSVFFVFWAHSGLMERQQSLHDLEVACSDLRAEVNDLKDVWPRLKNFFARKVRVPSRFEMGETLKAMARESRLHDMSFQVTSQGTRDGQKRLVIIDFSASRDRSVARFMRRLEDRFRGQMVAKSLLLEKGVIAQGSGELATGLSGCYILEWRSPRKRLLKGGKRG